MDHLLSVPQPAIRVAVDYYSKRDQEVLRLYPTATSIDAIVQSGISIPTAEFLTYYMFKRKRARKAGYRTYGELGRQIGRALTDLRDWVEWNGNSIYSAADVERQERSITERIGESIGLSVINRIHGLTEADWQRIPEESGWGAQSVFDYQVSLDNVSASDGESIIQIETKGSAPKGPKATSASAVRSHCANIRNKKRKIANAVKLGSYRYPADLRYGTISVIGSDPNGQMKCWLVDPIGDNDVVDPYRVRLLNRMEYLADWIFFLAARSQLASALSNRIEALRSVGDIGSLDGVNLVTPAGKPIELSSAVYQQEVSLFATRSHVMDGAAG